MQNPGLINITNEQSQSKLATLVSDYIAGMTDRFALQTFEKFSQIKTS
jgi:dGTP triphosphohydrolase